MACEWCLTSCSIESKRRSKIRKKNLSKSFSSPKEFPAPSVLRIRPGRPRKNNGLDIYNQTRSYEWQKKNLKTDSAWFHNFPFVSSSTRKIVRKNMYFLGCSWQIFVAAGRYLLTRLIYSLYRPRLLPRPSLHYGEAVSCVQKQSQSSQWEAKLKLLSGMQMLHPHCLQLPLSALVPTLVTQAGLSVLSWGRITLMCKMSIVR